MFRALLALLLPVTLLAGQGSSALSQGAGAETAQWRGEHRGPAAPDADGAAPAVPGRLRREGQGHRGPLGPVRCGQPGPAASACGSSISRSTASCCSPLPEEEKNTRIRPLVEQFSALRQQQQDLKRKFEDDIRSSLTPAQQGRFLLVVEEIQRALLRSDQRAAGWAWHRPGLISGSAIDHGTLQHHGHHHGPGLGGLADDAPQGLPQQLDEEVLVPADLRGRLLVGLPHGSAQQLAVGLVVGEHHEAPGEDRGIRGQLPGRGIHQQGGDDDAVLLQDQAIVHHPGIHHVADPLVHEALAHGHAPRHAAPSRPCSTCRHSPPSSSRTRSLGQPRDSASRPWALRFR